MDSVERMREASGNVTSDDPLVLFLYLLARQHITTGLIDDLIDNWIPDDKYGQFTNGWLGTWAQDAADRLRRNKEGMKGVTLPIYNPVGLRDWDPDEETLNEYIERHQSYQSEPKGALPLKPDRT